MKKLQQNLKINSPRKSDRTLPLDKAGLKSTGHCRWPRTRGTLPLAKSGLKSAVKSRWTKTRGTLPLDKTGLKGDRHSRWTRTRGTLPRDPIGQKSAVKSRWTKTRGTLPLAKSDQKWDRSPAGQADVRHALVCIVYSISSPSVLFAPVRGAHSKNCRYCAIKLPLLCYLTDRAAQPDKKLPPQKSYIHRRLINTNGDSFRFLSRFSPRCAMQSFYSRPTPPMFCKAQSDEKRVKHWAATQIGIYTLGQYQACGRPSARKALRRVSPWPRLFNIRSPAIFSIFFPFISKAGQVRRRFAGIY